jgi:large subunit ribosomal protein L25
MAISFELEAQTRHAKGKGASRRLRRTDQVPAILYGAGKEATPLVLDHNKVIVALQHESFYTHILTLKVDNQPEKVILKDLQRHAYKPRVMHMDFLRIRADEKLKMHVPLHFVGAELAPGVKEGGLVSHVISDVEISCLPADLPEYIEVDVSTMALDQLLHLSELRLPQGVEIVALTHGRDATVASIHLPRAEEETVAAAPAAAEGAAPAEGAAATAAPAGEQKAGDVKKEDKKPEVKKDAKKDDKK